MPRSASTFSDSSPTSRAEPGRRVSRRNRISVGLTVGGPSTGAAAVSGSTGAAAAGPVEAGPATVNAAVTPTVRQASTHNGTDHRRIINTSPHVDG
ncbi:hypothetical protein Voc01_025300 [Virgisporangium ochraceum]|uniref:Uncharacterized protein n=1 Tax=Virgisporangium ochraceum TaxID=65505 RepID=A0A8J3ZT74_9ACTN|nr:hypothetical protein Voc01_025300 [Virgisporangium ochraceum]